MSSLRNNSLNVGDKLLGECNTAFGVYYTPRGYEKLDVTSYLVYDVTFDATKLYMTLQHEDQLRSDFRLLPFNPLRVHSPRLAANVVIPAHAGIQ